MKSLALVLVLVAGVAQAESDAPLLIRAGEVAPVSGVLLPDSIAVADAKRVVGCEAERAELKKTVSASTPWWVIPVVAVVAAAAGAGVGVVFTPKK